MVKNIRDTQQRAGWAVIDVDGTQPGVLEDLLTPNPFATATQKTLAVVRTPNKAPLALLEQHNAAPAGDITILLHIDGNLDSRTKFGKFVKDLGDRHKAFALPDDWKAPEVAISFLTQEMIRLGRSMPRDLAAAVVERVGTNLGMLAFEALKYSMVTQDKVITPAHVKGLVASIAEAEILPLMDALQVRNRHAFLQTAGRLEASSKADPTMRVCRFLAPTAIRWLQAAHLGSMPPRDAASAIGISPWLYENKVLPAARLWGTGDTKRLIGALAASERAVFSGALAPWTLFTARLAALTH
jgi:DNA polymerase III delta subunit